MFEDLFGHDFFQLKRFRSLPDLKCQGNCFLSTDPDGIWKSISLQPCVEALMPRCLSGSKSNALRRKPHDRWVLFTGIDNQEPSRHLLSFFQIHCAFFSATLFPLPGNLIPCFADVGTVGMLWSKGFFSEFNRSDKHFQMKS